MTKKAAVNGDPTVTIHRISRLSSRRGVPTERLPEGLEILRFLCNQPKPLTSRCISEAIGMKEGLVAKRMPLLEKALAVTHRMQSVVNTEGTPGPTVLIVPAYTITDYGRTCAVGDTPVKRVNSVFNLASALSI